MGRLGNRDPRGGARPARACAEDPDLELAGVWTHFATADEPDSDFFDEQLERFAAVAAAVRAEFPDVTVHAANSAAVFRDPRSHFDMVRCGVAVYGLDPFQGDPAERGLAPALSLRSYVADVKRFGPGDSAGYGQTWKAEARDAWSAVLPLGYGDGVRRGLSNNAEVLIGGRRHPLVGTVSMDNVTIDLGRRDRGRAGRRGGPDRRPGRGGDPRRGGGRAARHDQLRGHLRDLRPGAARERLSAGCRELEDRLAASPAVEVARAALADAGPTPGSSAAPSATPPWGAR